MTEIEFGRLDDLPLRRAWSHEAHEFTPWLAENIGHISQAVGIPLELTGQEVRVETFAADILARNPQDGTVVLIENQLEQTDHTHLGQIMTYLAGLEAQTVIWIAPAFREPHLSAIRWLNEHTADGFSFFAVRLRVVRIGESPFAPIFEVVEKPNDWDRQLEEQVRAASAGISALGDARLAYWKAYKERQPNSPVMVNRASNQPIKPESYDSAVVVVYVGQEESGIFMRGPRGISAEAFYSNIEQHIPILEKLIGKADNRGQGSIFSYQHPGGLSDPSTWPELIDWQEDQLQRYLSASNQLAKEAI